MEELLITASRISIRFIDAIALLVIVVGTIEVFVSAMRSLFITHETAADLRAIWFRYARWLIAGLTFQLAADIIETSISPAWEDIGRLAAIAVIRTFLNYFLERDLGEVRERDRENPQRTGRAA
jgi:uncharacterized membrane protein